MLISQNDLVTEVTEHDLELTEKDCFWREWSRIGFDSEIQFNH